MPDPKTQPNHISSEASAFGALLVELGVTHVVALPDNTSAPLLEAIRVEPALELLSGPREGEIIALASGLWLGGAAPVVVAPDADLDDAIPLLTKGGFITPSCQFQSRFEFCFVVITDTDEIIAQIVAIGWSQHLRDVGSVADFTIPDICEQRAGS